jgi:hypothetical protein
MLLADVVEGDAPVDPFKATHISKTKKEVVIDKVNHVTHHKPKNEEEFNA